MSIHIFACVFHVSKHLTYSLTEKYIQILRRDNEINLGLQPTFDILEIVTELLVQGNKC